MKKAVSLFVAMTLLLTSCGSSSTGSTETQFKTLYNAEVETLNYLNARTEIELQVAANVVDTLVEYDKLGNITPCLATEWSVSDDGLVWTFKIREGVKWVDHNGDETDYELTANDFVTGIKWHLDPKNASVNEAIIDGKIKNAAEFFNGQISDFNEVGVKAIDNYTLEYTLEKPIPYFLTMLTYAAFLPVNEMYLSEQGDLFGTANDKVLYNGGYIISEFAPNERHVLKANEKYWDSENIHISQILETYNAESETLAPEMFLRGEIQQATITSDILGDWQSDSEKSAVLRPSLNGYYSYFYALNFNPTFDAEYEPENWKIAVNNESFRKSLFHGLDRVKPLAIDEPTNPESRIINTITPPNFVDVNGVDYTTIGTLGALANTDTFDTEKALEFKEQAMADLKGKATFPVKVLMPYNSGNSDWAKRAQVVEQQLETTLGKDYIDVIIEAGPSTGFLDEVRRPGNYALMEVNWGPDYADPETYTDPFQIGGTYNKPEYVEGYTDSNGEKIYTNLLTEAKSEVLDVQERYNKFAEAEAFLIEHAFVIPYSVNNPGYKASYLNPFEGEYAPFGICYLKYKYQNVLEIPLNTETFNVQKSAWEAEKANQ